MGNFEKFIVSHLIRSKEYSEPETHVAITDTEESGSGAWDSRVREYEER